MISRVPFKNTEISFSLSGQGPVIVWLHGFMENKSIWKKQLEYFDTYCTNLCVDLLGHGESGNVALEHDMELQAEVVLKTLEVLKMNSVVLVGHSMGGYIGLALLEKIKNRISKIVLLNSTSYADAMEKRKNRERFLKIIPTQKETFARLGVVNLFASDTKVSIKEIECLIEIAKNTTLQGITAALTGMKNRESRAMLFKSFKGDKLIVSGKKDTVFPVEISREEAELVEAKFVELNGGHMSYLESKTQLNSELKVFFGF